MRIVPPKRMTAVCQTHGMKGDKTMRRGDSRCWRVIWVLTLFLSLGVGAASWPAMAHEEQRAEGTPEPFLAVTPRLLVIKPAPHFALLDLTGREVRLSALRGRVVLLSFIYTQCPTACPLLTQQMARLQARLKHAGIRATTSIFFLSPWTRGGTLSTYSAAMHGTLP